MAQDGAGTPLTGSRVFLLTTVTKSRFAPRDLPLESDSALSSSKKWFYAMAFQRPSPYWDHHDGHGHVEKDFISHTADFRNDAKKFSGKTDTYMYSFVLVNT